MQIRARAYHRMRSVALIAALTLNGSVAFGQITGGQMSGPYVDARCDAGPAIEGQSFGGTGVKGTTSGGQINGITDPEGAGVTGISNSPSYPGVLGVSLYNDGEGVFGQGVNGVHGQSSVFGRSGAWGEHTGDGFGVAGSTASATRAGGIFTNQNGGDHLHAGPAGAPVFVVTHLGDVFVRGVPYSPPGAQGEQGPPGLKGPTGFKGRDGVPGSAGPYRTMRTIAACGASSGCQVRVLQSVYAQPGGAGCRVNADTGSCAINAGNAGMCCVCASQ